MAVCGIPASLPALHLSACTCECVSGAVCAHTHVCSMQLGTV